MKKVALLLLSALFLFPAPAPAEELKTRAMTLTLPRGWTYQVEEDENVTLTGKSGAVVTVTTQEIKTQQDKVDLDPNAIATFLSSQLRESGVFVSDVTIDGRAFCFTVAEDPPSSFRISVENGRWFVMFVIRNPDKDPDVETLLSSARYN